MDTERWEKVAQLYHQAEACEPARRSEFLAEACRGDKELRREVESLLEQDASQDGVLERVAGDALSWDFPERPLPAAIGRYRILGLVAEGGMGAVYEAEQQHPRRTVALKVIRPGLTTPELLRRFQQESEALGRLQHPGIAQIYEAGAADTGFGPQPYFAMEFIRGLSLLEHAKAHQLTTRQRLELMAQVCEAVHHAHERGIIHRDLKPGNILVDEKGQPKVLDFGVARVTDSEVRATRCTDLGELVGTLAYMSPEQVLADPLALDRRSDVYALGVILYEVLAGRLPYKVSGKVHEAVRAIREEDPTPLRVTSRSYRDDLETIVAKALDKEKQRRYASAADLAADIRRYLNGEPILARPASTFYQVRKFAYRHKGLVSTVAVVFVVLIAGILASTREALRANRAEQQAKAVSDFLQKDLLAQADLQAQAGPNTRPDPDLKVRTVLDRAAARIGGKFESQPVVEASIRQTIGNAYQGLGLHAEAQQQIERALDLRRRVLGPEHPDTLSSMNQLAMVFIARGRNSDAEGLLTRVVEAQRRLHRDDHPDALNAMYASARLAWGQGNYARAEELLAGVVQSRRRVLGEQHPDTLGAMNDLAGAYADDGKYAQAEELYKQVIEVKRQVLGPEHPSTLISMNSLGVVYRFEGKYAEAEGQLTEALNTRRRIVGEEHADTLASMNSLALLYKAQAKYAQAEPLLKRVLEVHRRVRGEEDLSTLRVMNNLAEVYVKEGQLRQAEPLFHKVLEVRRRVLGPHHPSTNNAATALAGLKLKQREYAEAEALLREALNGQRETGPDSWRRYYTESMLGTSLAGQGKYAEGEPLLLSGHNGMIRRQDSIPYENRTALTEVQEWIVQLYQAWGKPEKALEWHVKASKR